MRVRADRAEAARAVLIDLFAEGFEEREVGGDVELAAYTDRADAAALLTPLGPIVETPVAAGWETAWKGFHRPVQVGPLWVGPPWESPDDGAAAVVVDPGRAFGTGAHPTTRLCLELLLEIEPSGLVDLGCGSGVLAVAAARLGFAPVLALDDDEAAVEATRANAAANGVEVEARLADVFTEPLPDVEVAVANIARAPVERAAERFPGRTFVSSGYLAGEHPAPGGWRALERREDEGWAADMLVRVTE
ncbi:MAG TPA: 50S ribosomal protein L11 methyltransferase [Gaiellaceae bacterium]|nr:50S ribosomal protein L11 methyltransferase [Gaiellaceae bacterium]